MAALATEIAAVAADRHDRAVGAVMVNRLVADRSDFNRRDDAVRKVIQSAVTIHMRLAKPALAVTQPTTPQA